MGKKSKKGVSRAGTKKHNAAGHGKSATSTVASAKGRVRSDSKASYESGGSNNAFAVHDTGIAQNFTVNTKEQPASLSNLATGTDIHTILDILNKENNAAPGAGTPTMMTDIEKMIISPPRVPKVLDSTKEETTMDAPVTSSPNEVPMFLQEPTEVASEKMPEPSVEKSEAVEAPPVENVVDVETPLVEKGVVVDAPLVEKQVDIETLLAEKVADVETAPVEKVADIETPPVGKGEVVEPSPVDSVEDIAHPPDVVVPASPDSGVVDDQPLFCVSDNPVDANAEMEPIKEEVRAPTVPVPAEKPSTETKSEEPINVWSSKLRDAVSLIDTDEMANEPPVLDVTPVKQPSKLNVPVIQTVSPSPDTSKHVRPPPSLDTPDAKDVETVKQNECGCIIV